MNKESQNLIIDETLLDTTQQITLFNELIRIIEKDIDDERAKNSREGWTLWGILGAIAATGLLFFSETRNLTQFPVEIALISCIFIISFHILWLFYNLVAGEGVSIKEKRLKSPTKVFQHKRAVAVLSIVIYSSISSIIYFSSLSFWEKIFAISLILLPIVYMLLSVLILIKTGIPMGNNPNFQKGRSIVALFVLLSFLAAVIIMVRHLPFPVGTSLTAAYTLGICISIIVVLLEVLLNMASPSEVLVGLKDLKDDIVFRRVGLNTALNQYKVLKEGKTLFEEIKDDYEKIMSFLFYQEDLYNQIQIILRKLHEYAPAKDDTEVVEENKKEQTSQLGQSFQTYFRQLQNSFPMVQNELQPFNVKLNKAAIASGDYETQLIIQQTIQSKFNELVKKEQEMNTLAKELEETQGKLQVDLNREPR